MLVGTLLAGSRLTLHQFSPLSTGRSVWLLVFGGIVDAVLRIYLTQGVGHRIASTLLAG